MSTAAQCVRFDRDDPLAGLQVGSVPEIEPAPGWVRVEVRAAALNGHDLWSLRGVGLTGSDLPRTLGSDAAGVVTDSRRRVVVYPAVSVSPPETTEQLDPRVSPLLSERHDGTLADAVLVPEYALLDLPSHLSFEQAATLPTAWLTAYRMLFVLGAVRPGSTVLVQGATGGVSTALTTLASRAGVHVWVVTRSEKGKAWALEQGADAVFSEDERLPHRVDTVMETVGESTWAHSLRSLRVGGRLVVAGATSGGNPGAALQRVFFHQLQIIGARLGTLSEFRALLRFIEEQAIVPPVDCVLPLSQTRLALARLQTGGLRGKIVIRPGA